MVFRVSLGVVGPYTKESSEEAVWVWDLICCSEIDFEIFAKAQISLRFCEGDAHALVAPATKERRVGAHQTP